jgi:hypothetical protein
LNATGGANNLVDNPNDETDLTLLDKQLFCIDRRI